MIGARAGIWARITLIRIVKVPGNGRVGGSVGGERLGRGRHSGAQMRGLGGGS